MTTNATSPHVEQAILLVRTYVPSIIVENWRIVGTTAIMVGLCLCPIVASAWECPSENDEQTAGSDSEEE